MGFATVVGGAAVVLAGPVLSAVAKELPNVAPRPTEIAVVPAPDPATRVIIHKGLTGAICAAAVTSGSYLVGAACGLVVVLGILHMQSKPLFPK
jgi:hypothetical protein